MDLVTSFLFFLSFHFLLLGPSSACSRQPFPCGDFSLEFPLTISTNPGCGLMLVDGCDSSANPKTILGPTGSNYTILQQMSANKFLVQDTQLLDFFNNNESCLPFGNLSMPQFQPLSFTYFPNITLFTCFNQTSDHLIQDYFKDYRRINISSVRNRCQSAITSVYYYINETTDEYDPPDMKNDEIPTACSMIQLPLTPAGDGDDLLSWSAPNFILEWSVPENCFPSETLNEYDCSGGKDRILKKTLFIGGITTAALTSTLIILYIFIRRKHAKAKQELEKDIKLFLRKNGNLAPMRYKYSSIKKITKSFSENLGKGGYGSVYKGQFPDGHLVAVKVLDESNGNGEDFMNEVASISRTSHINIVALLGFCFEGPKRALIYDFMPNGSLEKFIDNTASAAAEFVLGLDKLFEIALGVARGLEYLHQGCNTRILHLDIKPQNILLDKDFNPRISDFGLAKMCPNRSSIVSMMVARGTIGYIAPEVFSRNFGEVSYKSDVYSYGMLVLEMVGGRKSINRGDVDHTSEVYFPHYIYKQLEMDDDVVEKVNEDETLVVKRNLIIVGLWCIQTNPKDRPSMTKVVEMLEGKLGALEVPPKPYLSSPPRSATTISSTSQSM